MIEAPSNTSLGILMEERVAAGEEGKGGVGTREREAQFFLYSDCLWFITAECHPGFYFTVYPVPQGHAESLDPKLLIAQEMTFKGTEFGRSWVSDR